MQTTYYADDVPKSGEMLHVLAGFCIDDIIIYFDPDRSIILRPHPLVSTARSIGHPPRVADVSLYSALLPAFSAALIEATSV